MYQFKPVNERVARLRDKVRDRLIIGDAEKSRIKAQAQAKYKEPYSLHPDFLLHENVTGFALSR